MALTALTAGAAAGGAGSLGSILGIAGAVLPAIGALSQGQSAREESDFKARVLQQQAARDREVAAEQKRDFDKNQSALLAQRRAELGGAGIASGTGTSLITEEDFLREAALQAERIRKGGEISATRLEQEAKFTKAAGKSTQKRGFFRAGSSLLTGIAGFT